MSTRRHQRSDMQRYLALRESHYLTFEELSRRTGVPAGTLSSWSYRLRREAVDEVEPSFVGLVAADDHPSELSDARHEGSLLRVRHPSGMEIEFEGDAALVAAESLLREITSWS